MGTGYNRALNVSVCAAEVSANTVNSKVARLVDNMTLFRALVHHAPDPAFLAVGDIERSVGSLRHAVGPPMASLGVMSGDFPAKPVAKISNLPDGLPFWKGWKITL